jgi:hypothetical protein
MQRYLLILLLFLAFESKAQNEVDALRYSWTGFGGSSRYMGLSGSMSGVGGDLSVIATNPAGLARFTRSDATISFGISDIPTESVFNSTSTMEGAGRFSVTQLGFVAASTDRGDSDWKSVQFSIGYNKLADFKQTFKAAGYNSTSSLLDVFVNEANGIPEQDLLDRKPFSAGLAYWAYLIDPDASGSNYTHQAAGRTVYQSRTVERTGALNETGISLSGNYLDKFYIGFTLGFPSVRFSETYIHSETVEDTSLTHFDYKQDLSTKGLGINGKFGIMFLPTEWLRLGIAFHTASSISLSDRWSNQVDSYFADTTYSEESIAGYYTYRLQTPGRIIGSAGFIIMKQGLINIDYEFVNYGRAKLKAGAADESGYSFSDENTAILENYQAAGNLRVGTEWRIKPFTVRAGYALYGSPIKEGLSQSDAVKSSWSAGLGYRNSVFYADVAWVNTQWTEDYYFYHPDSIDPASIKTKITQIVLSVGARF